jgi:tetratricopeptide (TPR) repeat protein
LTLKPDYAPARSLLASVRYRLGEWEEAARLADEVIAADRANISAWYLKGLSYARLGRSVEARSVLSLALSVDPTDEFVRYSLEDLLVSSTPAESPERAKWAAYHLNRAEEYASRNLSDQALFEYRRALRIDPYSKNGRPPSLNCCGPSGIRPVNWRSSASSRSSGNPIGPSTTPWRPTIACWPTRCTGVGTWT